MLELQAIQILMTLRRPTMVSGSRHLRNSGLSRADIWRCCCREAGSCLQLLCGCSRWHEAARGKTRWFYNLVPIVGITARISSRLHGGDSILRIKFQTLVLFVNRRNYSVRQAALTFWWKSIRIYTFVTFYCNRWRWRLKKGRTSKNYVSR